MMPEPNDRPTSPNKREFNHFIFKDLPSILLSLGLLAAGIWLLSLRIPGWSLLFGLGTITIGTIMTIFTLDDVARNSIVPPFFKTIRCRICRKVTYTTQDHDEAIC